MAVLTERDFLPKWIAWESTRVCNLSCVHCRCSSDINAEKGVFTTETAYRMIDDIAEVYKPVFVISGGEPLMREDIFDIASYSTGKGFRTCMATNGILITDETCVRMKESGIRMVSLSLDGATAEVHDDFRHVKGAFLGVIEGAKKLREHGIPFIINSSFTKRNQHDIAKTFKLAKSLQPAAWYMFMIVPTGRGEGLLEELISKEDYDEILKWHFEQEMEEKEILMRPTCAPHYYRLVPQIVKERRLDFRRRDLTFSTGAGKGCVAAQTICLIDCFGEVKPCSYLDMSAGNLLREKFGDIWSNSPLFKELRDFSSYKGRCGACEFLKVCGGCRARAYTVTGDYMEEEPFCNYVPLKMQSRE